MIVLLSAGGVTPGEQKLTGKARMIAAFERQMQGEKEEPTPVQTLSAPSPEGTANAPKLTGKARMIAAFEREMQNRNTH